MAGSAPQMKRAWFVQRFFRILGPGLITGASDDDPSGIATYSSVGAQFGYGLLWMSVWLLPMMLAVQEVCGRIAIVTRKGLAGVLQEHYARPVIAGAVGLLLIANTVNIGADLGAMADATRLLVPLPLSLLVVVFTVLMVMLEIFLPYRAYARVLKWLTLSLFSYIAAGIIVHPDWLRVLASTVVPKITFSKEYIFAIVAFFGTTITPYLFFWESSEEVEEIVGEEEVEATRISDGEVAAPEVTRKSRIQLMRADTAIGMTFSNVVTFFIVLTTAHVLHAHGITQIETAQEAALALRPLVGNAAFLLFALGIIGTGLLAVPILAGSSAYALAEIMKWSEGLRFRFGQAHHFYMVIVISTLIGLAMNFIGINPIKALYYSAWINGLAGVPLLYLIMIVGDDERIVKEFRNPWWVRIFGWSAMAFSTISVILTLFYQTNLL